MQPTQPLHRSLRRLALTTKQGPKNYYKGTRTGRMGDHTKHGRYEIDWTRVRRYIVPVAWWETQFQGLTPFVSALIEEPDNRREFRKWTDGGPASPRRYLEMWKEAGGEY